MDERVSAASSLKKAMNSAENGPGAHRAGGSLLEVDRPRFEADQVLQYRTNLKNAWRYTSTSPYAFME